MNKVSEFLQNRIDAGEFPSAVYLVAEGDKVLTRDALGFAVVEPEKIPASLDTIYDLASLTKVLATGLLCAKLMDKGSLELGDKLSKYSLPGFEQSEIRIEQLLTHTSGFAAWRPFYLLARGDELSNADKLSQVLAMIGGEDPEYKAGKKVVYSDLNFLILQGLIESLYGKSLRDAFEDDIARPLNLENTYFCPPHSKQKRIAASEKGNGYERAIVSDTYPQLEIDKAGFRSDTIWGEVHDNNCHFLGGVAGHAGLFSTVRETWEIAKQFLPSTTQLLKAETCGLFTQNLTPGLNQARSVAFQLAETPDSTAGTSLAKSSFGHLGFTGTSLWIDPDTERGFVLLTNRTHNRALPFADLKETRQKFHQIANQYQTNRA